MAEQQQSSPVIADEQGRAIFPSAIPPETTGMPELIAPQHYRKLDSVSSYSTLNASTPATAPISPSSSSPSDEQSTPSSCGAPNTFSSIPGSVARPNSHSMPDSKGQRKSITRSASEGLQRTPLRVPLSRKRAATSGIPFSSSSSPRVAVNRPFFYDFNDYSPSESDTTSTAWSSEHEGEEHAPQQQPPPDQATRKTLQCGGAGKGLEKADTQERRSHSENGSDASGRRYSRFSVGNQYFKTKGKVSRLDGRLRISVNETANSGWLAKALGSGIRHHLSLGKGEGDEKDEGDARGPAAEQKQQDAADTVDAAGKRKDTVPKQIPKLNIVIMVIGSRGDIQPFLKIGKILKSEHGHRVRIATHPAFKDFVEKDSGLEFFSVGGDPSELMAFMVKNPGLIPSIETVKSGEIGKRRKSMYEMFNGMWRACINATDDENDRENVNMMADKHPFIADAIIANPPSFAHVHIAERLGVPLHMMFTFPYTPTTQFPHPLANIKQTNIDESYTNFMSYPLVEMMTWQGLGDLVNKFRVKTLGLEPVSTLWAPGELYRLKVPYTYLWSPTLVPKPSDWGPEINIAGFTFLDLASSFTPPDALVQFLDAGPPPVYIGFGSIVVDDPDAFTDMIFRAVSLAGVRALVSKGWGGIGGGGNSSGASSSSTTSSIPENIFLLDNTPHDWLFPRVAAVVHHGGAGTTAIGLKCGRPTMIVPFFGDQPFWGAMVAKAQAGAHACVPYRKLTAERLAQGIRQCLEDEEARLNAARLAESIAVEGDGAENAVRSFHASLPLRMRRDGETEEGPTMRCSLLEEKVAAWELKDKKKRRGKRKHDGSGGGEAIKLSTLAAEILTERGRLKWTDLRLARAYDWNDFDGPGEPISGVGSVVTGTVVEAAQGIGSVPAKAMKDVKKHGRHEKRKRKLAREGKERKVQEEAAQELPYQEPIPDDTASGNSSSTITTNNSRHPQRPSPSTRTSSTLLHSGGGPTDTLPTELCRTAGHGLHQSASALARAPVDLALALAQGFHNAPRLYGDDTVRRPGLRITGWRSGARAARRELAYGVYDGWTGLWKQPARGWREGGAAGAAKGVGLGVGGVVLKNISAVVGPVGFCAKGLREEARRWRGREEEGWAGFIRRARVLQGRRELRNEGARREVEERAMRAWDSRFEKAEARAGENMERKRRGEEETQMREPEKSVPRRRSTLKKKQRPLRSNAEKKQAIVLDEGSKESDSDSAIARGNDAPEFKGKYLMAEGSIVPVKGAKDRQGQGDVALIKNSGNRSRTIGNVAAI
ncbi:UDP-sugar-dependent glycosyltransferase 52 [Diplodia seriata]|uniref:UDP-sugar-dependent glycosyltransferase 52 n=1 Tax=Diplodia seriata TaxID=420778 RepID=A0A1S8BNC7_9PEZI|nr:UDP-sugar-dependent glycosyltransferase 52 [Diplodia seriata]